MKNRDEKLEELLNSLRERNMTLDDLKTTGEDNYDDIDDDDDDDDDDLELLDDDSNQFDESNGEMVSNVELREEDDKEVDLGDFF